MEFYRHKRSYLENSGRKIGRWVTFSLLILLVVASVGCSKQLAGLNLDKARKLLMEAEQYEAQRLEPQEYENTRKLVEDAERLMNEQQYKRAKERASQAVDNAKKIVESSKAKLAGEKLKQAENALDVANKNHGVQEDKERYSKINELYNKAQEKHGKNDWEDVIQISEEIQNEVDALLSGLFQEAKSKYQNAQNKFEEMKTIGAEEYASDYVIRVKGMIQDIQKKIEQERDYVGAINQADEAIRTAEEGISFTKGKMAQEQIQKIEEGLSEAVNKGAQIYANDILKDCNESFDIIITMYYEKKYDNVLDSAEILLPKVEKLIYTTQLESAKAKINTVVKEIEALEEGGARQYLPGRLETIEEYLSEARNFFDQEEFEEAENQCMIALREADKTRSAFNDLALDAMRNAAESFDIARNVFDKMSDVFIVRSDLDLSGPALTFEQGKEAEKARLERILNNARLTLGLAKLRQEEGKYRKAIELSGEVKQSAEYVLNETYHVVAHNAIMEMADQITKREMDGGRAYASEELDRARNLLEETKRLMDEGSYKEAVKMAGETRAQLELTTQEVAQTAVENIEAARQKIDDADKFKADVYQKAEMARARTLLEQAENALADRNLKSAVEVAKQASTVVQEATREASRIWCSNSLNQAMDHIQKAEKAGALNYAAELMDESKRFYDTAENLLKSGDYLQGVELALRSAKKAQEAQYKNVIGAETAINEAKSYEGWRYEYRMLSQAIVDAKKAREALEEGQYIASSSYAEKAQLEANKVTRESQKEAFQKQVEDIKQGLDEAMHSGVNYFQTEKARKVFQQLDQLKGDFELDNFDYTTTQLDKLQADLEKLLDTTPEVLNKIAQEQKKKVEDLRETQAALFALESLDKAEDHLKYAQIDFDEGEYSQSFRELKKSIKLINEVESQLAFQKYIDEAGKIMDRLSATLDDFSPVLDLSPKMLKYFTKGPDGGDQYVSISGGLPPHEFREIATEMYHHAGYLEVPEKAKVIHNDFTDMLNDVRLAGVYFEKLIVLNEFETESREKIINRAYDYIERAQKKRSDLHKFFLNRDRKLRVAEGL